MFLAPSLIVCLFPAPTILPLAHSCMQCSASYSILLCCLSRPSVPYHAFNRGAFSFFRQSSTALRRTLKITMSSFYGSIETIGLSSLLTRGYSFTPLDLPPLTTLFTAPTGCSNLWYQTDTKAANLLSGWQEVESEHAYLACQAKSVNPTYSPGMCPEGQTIVRMTEWMSPAAPQQNTSVPARLWQAVCCQR